MPVRGFPFALTSICEAWADAWNRHDVDALARLVCPDVEFVNVAGVWLRGFDEFKQHHAKIHRFQMKQSTWTNVAHQVRQLNDDLFLMHLEWAIAGDRDPDGTPRRPRLGIFTWLIVAWVSDWRIAAAHNTNLGEGISHRQEKARKLIKEEQS
jgi:uncharacterized protein (TIGR02246 family)